MHKLLEHLLFMIFLLPGIIHAQVVNNKNNFNHIISIVKGDLNKDKLLDSVIVLQDTLDEKRPFRLQVFFKYTNAGYRLAIQNDSAIEVEFPNGKEGFLTGTKFSYINIQAAVLTINTELLRGYYEYKFRYENGYFAMIGFKQLYSDGHGISTTTDFNYLPEYYRKQCNDMIETRSSAAKERK